MAYLIFIAIITTFPLLVALLLSSRFLKSVVVASIINIGSAFTAYKYFALPGNYCTANGINSTAALNNCTSHSNRYFIATVANIIFAAVIWYLAFARRPEKPKTPYDTSKGPIVGSAYLPPKSKEGLRKFLKATGWLIVIYVILLVAGFIYALTHI